MVAIPSNGTVLLGKSIPLSKTNTPKVTIGYARNNDKNQIEVEGQVTKIWSRASGDILVKITMPGFARENQPRVSVLFEGGKLKDEDISLMEGDTIKVQGWLTASNNFETLKEFLTRIDKGDILEKYPELGVIAKEKTLRPNTYVIPSTIEYLDKNKTGDTNIARIEGIVTTIWNHMGSSYARLVVYDSHKHRDNKRPHYITVWFMDGMVDGREIVLLPKNSDQPGVHIGDRIRVSGPLEELSRSETLREFLLRLKKADLMKTLPNAGDIGDICSFYPQSAILAKKIVQYSSFRYEGE